MTRDKHRTYKREPRTYQVIQQLRSELSQDVLKRFALSKDLADDTLAGEGVTHGLKGILEQGQSGVDERGTQDNDQVLGGGQEVGANLLVQELVGLVRENHLLGTLRAGIGENDQGALTEVGNAVPALASGRGQETSLAGGLTVGVLLEEEVEAGGGSTNTYYALWMTEGRVVSCFCCCSDDVCMVCYN